MLCNFKVTGKNLGKTKLKNRKKQNKTKTPKKKNQKKKNPPKKTRVALQWLSYTGFLDHISDNDIAKL